MSWPRNGPPEPSVSCSRGRPCPRYLREREANLRNASYIEASRYLERYWKPLHAQAIEASGAAISWR